MHARFGTLVELQTCAGEAFQHVGGRAAPACEFSRRSSVLARSRVRPRVLHGSLLQHLEQRIGEVEALQLVYRPATGVRVSGGGDATGSRRAGARDRSAGC